MVHLLESSQGFPCDHFSIKLDKRVFDSLLEIDKKNKISTLKKCNYDRRQKKYCFENCKQQTDLKLFSFKSPPFCTDNSEGFFYSLRLKRGVVVRFSNSVSEF